MTVLAPRQLFGGEYPVTIYDSYRLGESVHFLGFPFGLRSEVGEMNSEFPIPWVKCGIVSGFEGDVIFLDGHNNPGFSGGPVVRNGGSDAQILGVVSAYKNEPRAVLDSDGQEGPYTYDLNTGIVVVCSATIITRLVSDNPVGLPVA